MLLLHALPPVEDYVCDPVDFEGMTFEAAPPHPMRLSKYDAQRCHLTEHEFTNFPEDMVNGGDVLHDLSQHVMALVKNFKSGSSVASLHGRDDALLRVSEELWGGHGAMKPVRIHAPAQANSSRLHWPAHIQACASDAQVRVITRVCALGSTSAVHKHVLLCALVRPMQVMQLVGGMSPERSSSRWSSSTSSTARRFACAWLGQPPFVVVEEKASGGELQLALDGVASKVRGREV